MVKARTKKQVLPPLDTPAKLWRLAFMVALLGIGISGLYTVNAAHEMRRLYSELGDVQRQQDALLEERSRLMLERGTLGSLQTIETIAETELDMEFPDSIAQVLE